MCCDWHGGRSRGVALLMLNLSTRLEVRSQHHAPAASPLGRSQEPTMEENWVSPSAGLDGRGKEKLPSFYGIWTLDHPAHSKSLYWPQEITHISSAMLQQCLFHHHSLSKMWGTGGRPSFHWLLRLKSTNLCLKYRCLSFIVTCTLFPTDCLASHRTMMLST